MAWSDAARAAAAEARRRKASGLKFTKANWENRKTRGLLAEKLILSQGWSKSHVQSWLKMNGYKPGTPRFNEGMKAYDRVREMRRLRVDPYSFTDSDRQKFLAGKKKSR